MQRRTFLQVLGALGISIAAPQLATVEPELKAVSGANPAPPLPEQGMYALMAFHKDMVHSPFYRVHISEVRQVFEKYAIIDGDHTWVKLPLMRRPEGIGNPFGDPYIIPGGRMAQYCAHKIIHCVGGVPFEVRKNKINGDLQDTSAPAILHTGYTAMLHPVTNMFSDNPRGEILVHA